MYKIDQFLVKYGVRETTSFSSPKIIEAYGIQLPFNSMIHYLTDSPSDLGIRGSHPLLQTDDKVRLSFIMEDYGNQGTFKRKTFNQGSFIRNYRAKQQNIVYSADPERAMRNERDLVVYDYSLLSPMYDYGTKISRFYDEWANQVHSIARHIDKVKDMRNHFIPVKLPMVLPKEADFKITEDKLSNEKLAEWVSPEQFWLREMRNIMLGKNTIFQVKYPENVTFVLIEGVSAVIVPMKQLMERGEKQVAKVYDLFEALYKRRAGVSEEALEEVEDDVDQKVELVPGVPNALIEKIVTNGESGKLTPSQQRRLVTIAQNYDELDNPFGEGSIKEVSEITPEKISFEPKFKSRVSEKIAPAHATNSSADSLFRDYIKNGVMEADTLNMLKSFQKAGVIVQDIQVEEKLDALNDSKTLKIKNVPVNGKASTWAIDLPVFREDGSFLADGVQYQMDTQKISTPISKTAPHRVALTSYYGKIFIARNTLVKHDYGAWLVRNINRIIEDNEDKRISQVRYGSNMAPIDLMLPRTYTTLMTQISQFKSKSITFNFEFEKRNEVFGEKNVKRFGKKGAIIVGKDKTHLYVLNRDDTVFKTDGKNQEDIGHFTEVIGGGWPPLPIQFSEIPKLKGKRISIGLVLGYFMGLAKLLKKLKVKYRSEPANIRSTAKGDEREFIFADERLIYKGDATAMLIINGFVMVKDQIKNFKLSDMNKRQAYGPILKSIGLEKYQVTELNLIDDLFVDPITEEILVDMKEPTTFQDLCIRSTELVVTDEHYRETDPKLSVRERRLERVPGFIYSTLVKAVREQRNKPNPSIHPVYIGQREVWSSIAQDNTTQLIKELNPIHTLKQIEAVSLSGEGGRGAKTLVKKSRAFDPNDVGRYSEATPDSGKVGIRTFTPPNPKIKNLRGMHGEFDFEKDGSTSVLSTTGLLLPASHHDDQETKAVR